MQRCNTVGLRLSTCTSGCCCCDFGCLANFERCVAGDHSDFDALKMNARVSVNVRKMFS